MKDEKIKTNEEVVYSLKEFFEENIDTLCRSIKDGKFLEVDFNDIIEHSTMIADLTLDRPESVIDALEQCVKDNTIIEKSFKVRFINLPDSTSIPIRDLRARHIGKFITIDGVIRQASDVRPKVTRISYECGSCGTIISILQVEKNIKSPSRCSCGRSSGFKMLAKDMTDSQLIVMEESHDELSNNAGQPKRMNVFLQGDLVDPKFDSRTTPGTSVKIHGILIESEIQGQKGVLTRFDMFIDANNIIPTEELQEDLELSEEEEERIKEVAGMEDTLEILKNSIAPSIFGHDNIKKALAFQLFGGVEKTRVDGTKIRENLHVLLCGDPGCCRKDTYVTLSDGTFKQIGDFGKTHHQDIKEHVMVDGDEKGTANLFWEFKDFDTKKITLSNGKKIVCSLIHPLLVNRDDEEVWVKARDLKCGDMVKIVTKVQSTKTSYEIHNKKNVDEEIALTWGMLIGDGYNTNSGYRVGFDVTDKKNELIAEIKNQMMAKFGKKLKIKRIRPRDGEINGRVIKRKLHINKCTVDSKDVCSFFKMEKSKQKRIPKCIMASKDSVVSDFLKGLFSTDGSCFVANTKDRSQKININFKSSSEWMLQDVQLLLTRFGIHSRINMNALMIRRYNDILLFREHIGFVQKNKNDLLVRAEEYKPTRNRCISEFEAIVSIDDDEVQDVYDITVPKFERYVSNGIISHNTAKSMLLNFMKDISPKGRYVSGKSASGVGITATVVKDEITKGWGLEAGAMVLANGGLLSIDELDKMQEEDRSNLHEAMSVQTVTISKATIQAQLKTKTSVLAAANPKYGRFNPKQTIAKQVNLLPSLLDRFDSIFIIRDIPDKEKDNKIADKILSDDGSEGTGENLSTDMMKKYVLYAKMMNPPKMTNEARKIIKDFYIKLRKKERDDDIVSPIQIGARQLESLVRMSEAHARIKLKDKVCESDAKIAVDLMMEYLMEIGYDKDSGMIDIDKISGTSTSKRNKLIMFRELIKGLEKEHGKSIPEQKLIELMDDKINSSEYDEMKKALRDAGELIVPIRGIIQLIN